MPTRRLARRLKEVSQRLIRATEIIVGSIAEAVSERVILDTPLDTGLAKGNWRSSLNAPAIIPISFTDPSGQATISRARVVARIWRVGDTFFLQNNLDYIGDLNRGKSTTQQPTPGYVGRSVSSGVRLGIARVSGGLNL